MAARASASDARGRRIDPVTAMYSLRLFVSLIRKFVGFLALWVVLLGTLISLSLAADVGTIRGKAVGPDGQGKEGAVVELRNAVTGFLAQVKTGKDGSFQFFNIPFNPYMLRVDATSFQTVYKQLDVRSPIPMEVKIELTTTLTESVKVTAEKEAQLETDTSMSHLDIDKSFVAKAPAPIASRAMEQIVTSTPGFAKDENGRFHFQGAHSQDEYVVDGPAISEQTGMTFSNSIDPGIAQGIEVIYGNVPAEYGEKIGAVINLATKSVRGAGPLKGDLLAGTSRFGTYEGGVSTTYGTENFGLFASI